MRRDLPRGGREAHRKPAHHHLHSRREAEQEALSRAPLSPFGSADQLMLPQPRSLSGTGEGLARLITPAGVDTFVGETWGRATSHAPAAIANAQSADRPGGTEVGRTR